MQDFTGAFTQANVTAHIDAVTSEAQKQGLDSAFGSSHPAAIVIVTEDPTGKDEVHLQIGLELPANAEVRPEAPLKVVPMKFEKAVQYVHQGPYTELPDVHRAIHDELQRVQEARAFRSY